jgi:hypothetical protein
MDELLDEITSAFWFTKVDLRSGYHQLRVADVEQHKTSF